MQAQVGKRVNTDDVRALMLRWEGHFQRNTLVDQMMNLRSCVQCAASEADLLYLLETLYYEQRGGLRPDGLGSRRKTYFRTPTNVAKAVLIRRSFLAHLAHAFPAFKKEVEYRGTAEYYAETFKLGAAVADAEGSDQDDDGCDEEEPDFDRLASRGGDEVSTYKSKGPLILLCDHIMRNRYERTFIKMAQDGTSDVLRLDLTAAPAAPLFKACLSVSKLYEQDFPAKIPTPDIKVVPPAAPGLPAVHVTVTPQARPLGRNCC